jgi:hypothetical protein
VRSGGGTVSVACELSLAVAIGIGGSCWSPPIPSRSLNRRLHCARRLLLDSFHSRLGSTPERRQRKWAPTLESAVLISRGAISTPGLRMRGRRLPMFGDYTPRGSASTAAISPMTR